MQRSAQKLWQRMRGRYDSVSSPDFSTVHGQVLSYVIHGTCAIVVGLFILLLVSYGLLGNHYVAGRILVCAALILYMLLTRHLLKKRAATVAAWMVLGFYGILTLLILWSWSINTPIGALLLGFMIMLSGITLGARAVSPVSIGVICMMVFVQFATQKGWATPDYAVFLRPAQFTDIVGYLMFFGAFGLISWIASKKMEQLFAKQAATEEELRRQKASVAQQLVERTKALQETQLRETKYLYGFAELGQLSTALLHDLSNHLTVLSLEIEDLEKQKHSKAIARAQKSIHYLDEMVCQVRAQLKEGGQKRLFYVQATTEEVFNMLQAKALGFGVRLQIESVNDAGVAQCYGDPVRFRYIMTILLTNAIDAYSTSGRTSRRVTVRLVRERDVLLIRVTDWGVGVPSKNEQKVFQPFYSTKDHGMGIGLFIVKEMLQSHFHGTIALEHSASPTVFLLQLPIGLQSEDDA